MKNETLNEAKEELKEEVIEKVFENICKYHKKDKILIKIFKGK